MGENVHGNTSDRIKRTQQIERLGRAKPEYGLVARHDHKRLQTEQEQHQCSVRYNNDMPT